MIGLLTAACGFSFSFPNRTDITHRLKFFLEDGYPADTNSILIGGTVHSGLHAAVVHIDLDAIGNGGDGREYHVVSLI